MENIVNNYTFTVIEDGQVPLAGNFNTTNYYTPVVVIVALGVFLVAIVSYVLWLNSHSKIIASYNERSVAETVLKYFFHPARLIREEKEIEYALVEVALSN